MSDYELIRKLNLPITLNPANPNSYYIRLSYQELFVGPFNKLSDIAKLMDKLEDWDKNWDYNGFDILHGVSTFPADFIFGFNFISESEMKKINKLRNKDVSK